MLYASFHLRRLPARTFCTSVVALALLAPTAGLAQPPNPPTPQQQLEQRMQEMRNRAMVQANAPRPPQVRTCDLSPDGKIAVSYSSDGKVTLWDANTGKDIRTLAAHEPTEFLSSFNTAQFSPDAKFLLTLGTVKLKREPDKPQAVTTQAKLWEVATGKLLWTVPDGGDEKPKAGMGNGISWSSDGKMLASKSTYGPIFLWDVGTGELLRTLNAPFMNMESIAFSPDGKTIAGGGYRYPSYSSEILLWNVQSGELERSLKQPDPTLGMQVMTIAFSPDGKSIALGGGMGKHERINEISGRFNVQHGIVQLWDVKSGVLFTTFAGPTHRNLVTTLAFSPDGTRLATGSFDQTVGLWDAKSARPLATTTRYGIEPFVNINNGKTDVKPTGVGVRDLVFSSDGKTLDILSNDKMMRTWDISAPAPQSDPLQRVIPNSDSRYSSFAFSPNNRWLVSGEYRKQVRFWRMDNLEESDAFFAHDDAIVKVAVSSLGPNDYRYSDKAPLLATGSNLMEWRKTGENSAGGYATGFEIKLWNPQSHELKRTFTVPGFALSSLVVSAGGRWVAAAGGLYGPPPAGGTVATGGGMGIGLAVNGPEDVLKAQKNPQEVKGLIMLWDAASGELKHKLTVQGDITTDLAFSPDGSILVSDSGEAGVSLWNTTTGAAIRTLDEEPPPPGIRFRMGSVDGKPTLAFTKDGAQLARSRNGSVKFWNVQTGDVVSTLTDPEVAKSGTSLMALTPDGKNLVTTGILQSMKLWDVATGKVLWQSPDKDNISAMAITPDGKTLATTSGNGIRLWDITKAAQGTIY